MKSSPEPASPPTGEASQGIQAVIDEFCPRYTPGGTLYYRSDDGAKTIEDACAHLAGLNLKLDADGTMPDLIVHLKEKNWLVLIETASSHGPIDEPRKRELEKRFADATAHLVFVSAFPSREPMAGSDCDLAWETAAWIAEEPGHLIHFNGGKLRSHCG